MEPTLTCPAALPIGSGPHGRPAAVCGILERDARRADRILEGAPVGVLVSSANDPSTYFGFCCGAELPPPDVEAAYRRAREDRRARVPQSYACCPVWEAASDWDLLSRLYALRAGDGDGDPPELTVGALTPGGRESAAFLGEH